MKTLNYLVVFALLLSFSCNKQNETPLNPINKTETKSDFAESSGLFYFDIPAEYQAVSNASISNTEIITEDIELEDGTVLSVTIEHVTSKDGKIISIGVTEDFCALKEINYTSFITDNIEDFNNELNAPERPQRGWLGRFFIGRVVNTPCVLGARNWMNDPWWGPPYGGGEEPC